MLLQLVTILGLGAMLFAAVLFTDSHGGEFSYVDARRSYEHPEVPDDLDNEYRVCITRVNKRSHLGDWVSFEARARGIIMGYRDCYREIVLGLP